MNMNKDEIKNMPAGKEMDALIAIEVMGLPDRPMYGNSCAYCGSEMWHGVERSWCSVCEEWRYSAYKEYSDGIEEAWEVVEKLCNESGCDVVKVCKRDPELLRGEWSCNFGRGYEAFGDTAPLAICRAALLHTSDLQEKR
jgi:hypothetical protein